MKRGLTSLLFLLILACCGHVSGNNGSPTNTPTPTPTAVDLILIPHVTIEYYDIVGSTESELRAQMDKLGPLENDTNRFDARTDWYIRWNWPGYGSAACDLGAVTVTYTITVIMPRWAPPKNASPALVRKWENYIRDLTEHEKGHVDNIVNNHPSVKVAIQGATCETADSAGQVVLDAFRQQDREYDKATDHGATQGAVFP